MMEQKTLIQAYKLFISNQILNQERRIEKELQNQKVKDHRGKCTYLFCYPDKNFPNCIVLKDKEKNYFFLPFSTRINAHDIFLKYMPVDTALLKWFLPYDKDVENYENHIKDFQKLPEFEKMILLNPNNKIDYYDEVLKNDPLYTFDRSIDAEVELRKYNSKEDIKELSTTPQKIGIFNDLPFPLLNIKNNLIDTKLSFVFSFEEKTETQIENKTVTHTQTIPGKTIGYNVQDVGYNNYRVTEIKSQTQKKEYTTTVSTSKSFKVIRYQHYYVPYFENVVTQEEKQELEECWNKTIKIYNLLAKYGELGFFSFSEKSSLTKQIDSLIKEQTEIVSRIIGRVGKQLASECLNNYKQWVECYKNRAEKLTNELKLKNISEKKLKKSMLSDSNKLMAAYNNVAKTYSKLIEEMK